MIAASLDRPWLIADLGGPHRVLSWTLNRPGFVTAHRLVWRQVRDGDLPRDLDARLWFAQQLEAAGLTDAPAFLTSRDIGRHHAAAARVEDAQASCLVTAGLGNAERVGQRLLAPAPALQPQMPQPAGYGTVNLALRLGQPMSEGALIEALSVAVAARTLAMTTLGPRLPDGPATGTGTDCIAVAAPIGPGAAQDHAGLHTAAGEAIGRAVLVACEAAIAEWMDQKRTGAIE